MKDHRVYRFMLVLPVAILLISCTSFESELEEESDRALCSWALFTADMDWRMPAIQIEIASRGVRCLDYFSEEKIAQEKSRVNKIFAQKQRGQQAKEQREREQRDARIADRKRVAEQNQANARNSVRLVSKRYETYYGRNNERKRRTLCEYSDGRVVEYSQSACPLTQ